jgi:hypothetical protein
MENGPQTPKKTASVQAHQTSVPAPVSGIDMDVGNDLHMENSQIINNINITITEEKENNGKSEGLPSTPLQSSISSHFPSNSGVGLSENINDHSSHSTKTKQKLNSHNNNIYDKVEIGNVTTESLFDKIKPLDNSFIWIYNYNKSNNLKPLPLNRFLTNIDLCRYVQNLAKSTVLTETSTVDYSLLETYLPDRVELRRTSNPNTNRFVLIYNEGREFYCKKLYNLLHSKSQVVVPNKPKIISGIVGPIPPHLTQEEVSQHFNQHGFIGKIKLISDGGYLNIGKANFEILESNIKLIDHGQFPGFGLKQLFFSRKIQPKIKCCYLCRAIGHTTHDCTYKSTPKDSIPLHCLLCGEVHPINLGMGNCKNKKENCLACNESGHTAVKCKSIRCSYEIIKEKKDRNTFNKGIQLNNTNFPNLNPSQHYQYNKPSKPLPTTQTYSGVMQTKQQKHVKSSHSAQHDIELLKQQIIDDIRKQLIIDFKSIFIELFNSHLAQFNLTKTPNMTKSTKLDIDSDDEYVSTARRTRSQTKKKATTKPQSKSILSDSYSKRSIVKSTSTPISSSNAFSVLTNNKVNIDNKRRTPDHRTPLKDSNKHTRIDLDPTDPNELEINLTQPIFSTDSDNDTDDQLHQ